MTHDELVKIARKWLKARCPVVITEIAGGQEEPDAIGWKSHSPILIECKATRQDFLSDRHKSFRRYPESGLGHKRYYMAPKGLLKPDELPDKWGLIEVAGKRTRLKKEAGYFKECNRVREVGILLSVLQRVGQNCHAGISIRVYQYETKNRATLTLNREELCFGKHTDLTPGSTFFSLIP